MTEYCAVLIIPNKRGPGYNVARNIDIVMKVTKSCVITSRWRRRQRNTTANPAVLDALIGRGFLARARSTERVITNPDTAKNVLLVRSAPL